MRWVSGPTTLQFNAANNLAFGGVGLDRNILFNGSTGAFISKSAEITSYTITALADGWFRITATFTPTSTTAFSAVAFYAASGTVFDAWGAQLETGSTATAYIPTTTAAVTVVLPRITNRGILVEEARTNLLPRSTEFDNASWAKSNTVVTANTSVAPDGTTTGDTVAVVSNGNSRSILQYVSVAASVYTQSFYIKAGTVTSADFGLYQGAAFLAGTAVILSGPGTVTVTTNVGRLTGLSTTQWTRVAFTLSAPASAGTVDAYYAYPRGTSSQIAGDSVELWGAQLELGAFATSPIITTGAAGTRGADVALVGSLTSFAYPLSMAGEWSREGGTDAATFYSVAALEPNADDRSNIFQRHTTNEVRAAQRSLGGVLQADITMGTGTIGNGQKAAVRFATDNVAGSFNGAAVVTDTSATMSASPIRLCVGSAVNGASSYLSGYVRRVRVLPYAATDAQLQALTS
jgi:hypothetical protein